MHLLQYKFIQTTRLMDIFRNALSKRLRHNDIIYHYIKQSVERRNCNEKHIKSETNIVDIFTKFFPFETRYFF
jgi:hypothetical protein